MLESGLVWLWLLQAYNTNKLPSCAKIINDCSCICAKTEQSNILQGVMALLSKSMDSDGL